MKRTHQLRVNKKRNQSFVEIEGQRIHLGSPDDPGTLARYHSVLAGYYERCAKQNLPAPAATLLTGGECTVAEICAEFLKYAKEYYSNSPAEVYRAKLVIQSLMSHAMMPAVAFGPNAFREYQQGLIPGHARKTVNDYMGTVRRMFRWAASREMIPVTVYQALETVEPLRRGRSDARDAQPIRPVSPADIEAVRPHASAVVWDMVQVQLLSAARPGEICSLRVGDIVRTNGVWSAEISDHKNAWRGLARTLRFGPQAQVVLAPYLDGREPVEYVFTPTESVKRRAALARGHRRPDQTANPRRTERRLRDRYDVSAYRRAVARACEKAGVSIWHPHQLRHTAATLVRASHGPEAARVVLGHKTLDATAIYAERDERAAVEVAKAIG